MTITIKARTAALALALLCILAGMAIGNLTHADSAGGSDAAQLRAISNKLGKISSAVGGGTFSNVNRQLGEISDQLSIGPTFSLDSRLRQIEGSSSGTCRAVKGIGC
jgi:hypothetical protein